MEHAAERTPEVQWSVETAERQALRRVFIVGFPRSGTTWMMWLLARLPRVVTLQQSGLFHALRGFERWWTTDHAFSKRADADGEAASSELNGGPMRGGGRGFDGTTSVLDRERYNALVRPICAHVFDRIASASPGTEVVVEQTPENMELEKSIRGLFPDAYFLHVVRDPRDAAVSMLKAAKAWRNEFPGRPAHVANRWNEYIARARELRQSTDRYLEIRYEDLKTNGATELKRVAAWLGVDADESVCQAAIEECTLDRMRSQTDMPDGFFGKGTAGGFANELSSANLRLVEYIVGENMESYGYERKHPKSRTKPMRLSLHEALAARLGRSRLLWRVLTRGVRKSAAHVREEVRYTQAKGSS